MRLPVDHLLDQRMKPPMMKSVNNIGILNLIRENGPVSRADLAKLSRLSKPTVSSLVDDLTRRGLVLEEGPGQAGARGGKIPTLVKFNAARGLLAGVDIGPEFIRTVLTDLEGAPVDRSCTPTCVAEGHAAVLGRVEQAIRDLLARGRGRRVRLRAVAIASYGRVDVDRGRVLAIGNVFNWTDVPVRERLAPVFRVPVFVDNDVNMAALGELRHGAAAGERDFVLIHLKTGIGCGVVLGGKLHHGAHWAAGEIAHAVVAESAAGGEWRKRGYLEHVLSEDRLIERIRQAGIGVEGDALAALVDAASAGDAQARCIMDQVTTHLGVAVAATAAAYDPAVVVLYGRLFALLFEQVGALIQRVIPWGVKLRLSTLGDEAILLGTVIAARSLAYERIALELNT